ncbi:retention module-containing protein [Spiribacter vilamensis]|uniref:Putative secreted protein (Type I secretion substrate) n=1 Tax=Spiribacter vilamensis TaxID=531306 RepID=A0A4Q8D0T3_9GAMM|nr:retention module-containing protein [Spiribacter vilamensis]RZU98913.1 putative secreted protein (type I secretion substrate) [Spiribacter vilamensis]
MDEAIATVLQVEGEVWARAAGGEMRLLSAGDSIFLGETVVTAQGASAGLGFGSGEIVQVANGQSLLMSTDLVASDEPSADEQAVTEQGGEDVLALLDGDGDILEGLEAPAAGDAGAGGAAGGGRTLVEVTRVVEQIDPLAFEFDGPSAVDNQTFADAGPGEAGAVDVTAGITVNLDDVNAANAANAPINGGTTDVEEGQQVGLTITDGTTTVNATATIQSDGSYSTTANLAGLTDGNLTVTATVQDQAGNTATDTDSAALDTEAQAGTVIVDDITADDIINATESVQPITVIGSAIGGDISADDPVTMTINGTTYTTTVASDGTWSVEVDGSDLAADTKFDVTVDSTDDAGNTVTSTGKSTHGVDTDAGRHEGDSSDDVLVGSSGDPVTITFGANIEVDNDSFEIADLSSPDSEIEIPVDTGANVKVYSEGYRDTDQSGLTFRGTGQKGGMGVDDGSSIQAQQPSQLGYREYSEWTTVEIDGELSRPIARLVEKEGSQTIVMNFDEPSTGLKASVNRLFENEGEVGQVEALYGGESQGVWTFSGVDSGTISNGDTIDFDINGNNGSFELPAGVVFDQLRFTATDYADDYSKNNDSSDYYLKSITYEQAYASDDLLIGGNGNDELTGLLGNDVFQWNSGDQGDTSTPANDVITDFGTVDGNKDVLDLRDLLVGEEQSEPISDFLSVEEDTDNGDLVFTVSHDGGLGDAPPVNATQTIRLEGKQFADFDDASTSDELIQNMLDNGQLSIDT